MKPTFAKYYEVPNGGAPVKTLAEWQRVAVRFKLAQWKDEKAEELSSEAFNDLIGTIIAERVIMIEILSQTEKGRPNGAKDRKPRAKKSVVAVIPTSPAS